MTSDKPQPATTGTTRLKSTHRTTALRFVVANKRKHELKKYEIANRSVPHLTYGKTPYSSTLPVLGQR